MTETPPAKETMTMRIIVYALVVVVLVLPFIMLGSGAWLLVQRERGEKVDAEVLTCDFDIKYKTSSQHCTARWTEDGVEKIGPIHGSGDHEVGETVTATLRGDDLYSRSLTLPLILIGLGLLVLPFPLLWFRRKLKDREHTPGG